MKKKRYVKPDVKVHQVKPVAILAGSVLQGMIPTEPFTEGDPISDWE